MKAHQLASNENNFAGIFDSNGEKITREAYNQMVELLNKQARRTKVTAKEPSAPHVEPEWLEPFTDGADISGHHYLTLGNNLNDNLPPYDYDPSTATLLFDNSRSTHDTVYQIADDFAKSENTFEDLGVEERELTTFSCTTSHVLKQMQPNTKTSYSAVPTVDLEEEHEKEVASLIGASPSAPKDKPDSFFSSPYAWFRQKVSSVVGPKEDAKKTRVLAI